LKKDLKEKKKELKAIREKESDCQDKIVLLTSKNEKQAKQISEQNHKLAKRDALIE
jgi:hypothetical protein